MTAKLFNSTPTKVNNYSLQKPIRMLIDLKNYKQNRLYFKIYTPDRRGVITKNNRGATLNLTLHHCSTEF